MYQITVDREDEQLIRERIASGRYADEAAVVHEAFKVLTHRDRFYALRAEIQLGLDDIERGDVEDLTDELIDRLSREAEEMVRRGDPVHGAVKP
jgi:putative addiction module CopG family antidote